MEYQREAEQRPIGYWKPHLIAGTLSDGVHQIFRETVFSEQLPISIGDKFRLRMSNGDRFIVTVTPEP